MKKIVRVNCRTREVKIAPESEVFKKLGGRALTSKILLDEVNPACDPLGSKNKLIIAGMLLAGTTISTCNRISVGTKSPLTGGIKESNVGGTAGWYLASHGIKALILEDAPINYESTPGVRAPGAYAEYFFAASQFVRRLPETIDDNTANMIEPCGIAYKAAARADIKLGDKVLVTGSGIIGLLSAAWAKAMGATYVAMTEVNDKRINLAKKLSEADEIFDAKDPDVVNKLMKASKGGFDKVIECTAAEPAVNLAIDVLKYGGKMIFVGVTYKKVPFNALNLVMKEISMEGIFGASVVFDKVIELLSHNLFDVSKYITKEIGLDEVQEAFEELHRGDSEQIKIVITP